MTSTGSTLATYRRSLQHKLEEHGDSRTRTWWQGYVKGSAPFLGVKMADVRAIVHEWHREEISGRLSIDLKFDLAVSLFFETHTEQKLAGILLLREIVLPEHSFDCESDLKTLARVFSARGIYDWNVCDWFCMKVLGPIIDRHGEPAAGRIAAWSTSSNVWQARASLVAFVPVAHDAVYYPLIETSCARLIQREERFAKTAVGWILREMSVHDADLVRSILGTYLPHCTPEVVRNATKYFDPAEQRSFKIRLREGDDADGS